MNIIDITKGIFAAQSFDTVPQSSLIEILKAADDLYHNGEESFLTDADYDFLWRNTNRRFPGDQYFTGIGSEVRTGKIKLPYAMGSLDQIHEGEIEKWVTKHALGEEFLVLTDKLDGTSAMLLYNDSGELQIGYSRGNGVEGADITRHLNKFRSVPDTMPGAMVIRGENIIELSTFSFLNDQIKTRAGKEYKNPQRMISGLMNAKVNDGMVYDYLKFVAYEIIGSTLAKEEQLRELEELGFEVPHSLSIRGKAATDDALTKYLNIRREASVYEIDGLVMCVNSKEKRAEMIPTTDSLNPKYSIKYKVGAVSNIAETVVIGVDWGISKHGYLKPRINIDAVELGGVTIQWVTGFNAKYIFDNGIGAGAVVHITRAGDVIPQILDIITPAVADMPAGEWEWSVNEAGEKIDAVLLNPNDSEEVTIKRTIDFFEKIEAPMLKAGSIQKLYIAGHRTIISIIQASRQELVDIIGQNGNKIFDGLREKLTDIPLYKLIGAHSNMRGIGIRKIKKLQSTLGTDILQGIDADTIAGVDGFDQKTAVATVVVLEDFMKFYAEVEELIGFSEEESRDSNGEIMGVNICLSGFRDKALSQQIEQGGGTIQNSVSSKTNIVVTTDPDGTTGKVNKARKLGIKIMSVEDFTAMLANPSPRQI